MKTRFHAIVLTLVLMSACALAQTGKWETVNYTQMGFSLQMSAGSTKRPAPGPEEGTLDLYTKDSMVVVISVWPASDTQLASTRIEKSIQAEIKNSPVGPIRRWEQTSKQGDLFKGYAGTVGLSPEDTFDIEIGKIVGGMTAARCSSMAPLWDDTAPILCITVTGPAGQENEITAIGKAIAASVRRYTSPPKANAHAPAAQPKPRPALKKGQIEIEGVVESVAKDSKSIDLKAVAIKLCGQERIALTPARPKQILLKAKPGWLGVGRHVVLIGKNTGIGKPMTADLIEAVKQ